MNQNYTAKFFLIFHRKSPRTKRNESPELHDEVRERNNKYVNKLSEPKQEAEPANIKNLSGFREGKKRLKWLHLIFRD